MRPWQRRVWSWRWQHKSETQILQKLQTGCGARGGGMLPTGRQCGHPPSLVEEGGPWNHLTRAGAGCGLKIVTVNTKNIISKNLHSSPVPLIPLPDPPKTINTLSHPQQCQRRVPFQLLRTHIDRDITAWRHSLCARLVERQQRKKVKHYRCRLNHPLAARLLKRGVLDGTIPSAVSDTVATSSAGLSSDRASIFAM